MKRFGLVGKGIENSYSPFIHNYCFEELSIDAKYEIFNISNKSEIKDIVWQLKNGDLDGINITTPYKQSFNFYLDSINPRAEMIGSINCIHSSNKQLIGNNTDWYGFLKSSDGMGDYSDVIIFGLGGVVPSLLYYFKNNLGCKIHLIGRDKNNLKVFQNNQILGYNIEDFNINAKDGFIVNSIPRLADISWNALLNKISGNIKYAVDLNYHLKVTNFLNSFNPDVKIKNGLDMLIYQALMSIDIWYGEDLSLSINIERLKNRLAEKYYGK